MAAWARDPRCVVPYATLYHRAIRAGWTPELAISAHAHRAVVMTTVLAELTPDGGRD